MLGLRFSTHNFIGPRKSADGYPLDLDGSLRYVRPHTIDNFPYPTTGPLSGMNGRVVDYISGILPQANAFFFSHYNTARTPYGPNINDVPSYADFQIAVLGLTKR